MKIISLSLLLLFCSDGFAQLQSYNKAMIWRGFSHRWTYNHRCNRLGDYVVYNNGNPQAVHLSATGIGKDSSYFKSFYTYVETPDAVFQEGKVNIRIENKEKQLSEGTVKVKVAAETWLQNKPNYESLLNGFDLKSDDAADKIQLMRLFVEDPVYLPETQEVELTVKFSLVMGCQSAECVSKNNKVNYNLDVYYLIVGLEEYNTSTTEKFFTRSYSWDKKENLGALAEEKKIDGISLPIFDHATVGMKAFSVVLNEPHWLLEFRNNFIPVHYNPRSGDMHLSVDLLFKEWQEGMKDSNVAPGQSKFSVKRKGWVVLDSDALLLQMKEAQITYLQREGQMYWGGSNQKPNDQDDVNAAKIPLH